MHSLLPSHACQGRAWHQHLSALAPTRYPASAALRRRHALAVSEHRRTVGLLWVLGCIAAGRPLPASRHRRYRPFELRAFTTPSMHRVAQSGFLNVQRKMLLLLLRCTGGQVRAGARRSAAAKDWVAARVPSRWQRPRTGADSRRCLRWPTWQANKRMPLSKFDTPSTILVASDPADTSEKVKAARCAPRLPAPRLPAPWLPKPRQRAAAGGRLCARLKLDWKPLQ